MAPFTEVRARRFGAYVTLTTSFAQPPWRRSFGGGDQFVLAATVQDVPQDRNSQVPHANAL